MSNMSTDGSTAIRLEPRRGDSDLEPCHSEFIQSITMSRYRARELFDGGSLREIGSGTCGTVFAIGDTDLAYKKGHDVNSMFNDFRLTNTVCKAVLDTQQILEDAFPDAAIPRTPKCHMFQLPGSGDWWKYLPEGHCEDGARFLVDRIQPISEDGCQDLIGLYFDGDEAEQSFAEQDDDNYDCLIRVYFGENESEQQKSEPYKSTRNFPLRLNMIYERDILKAEKIPQPRWYDRHNLPLVTEMAIGLATIHWQAKVDGMGCEFVLGSAPSNGIGNVPIYIKDAAPYEVRLPRLRPVHLWMLDFDKASNFSFTPDDVDKKLVPAFLGNDPYYPRPDVDEGLWQEFCTSYVKASQIILQAEHGEEEAITCLPKLFLDKVEEMINKHEG